MGEATKKCFLFLWSEKTDRTNECKSVFENVFVDDDHDFYRKRLRQLCEGGRSSLLQRIIL